MLEAVLGATHLQTLDLGANGLTGAGFEAFLPGLAECSSLQTLEVGCLKPPLKPWIEECAVAQHIVWGSKKNHKDGYRARSSRIESVEPASHLPSRFEGKISRT